MDFHAILSFDFARLISTPVNDDWRTKFATVPALWRISTFARFPSHGVAKECRDPRFFSPLPGRSNHSHLDSLCAGGAHCPR
jgi:hypothetical protein